MDRRPAGWPTVGVPDRDFGAAPSSWDACDTQPR